MIEVIKPYLLYLSVAMLYTSCSTTKYLNQEEKLLVDIEVKIDDEDQSSHLSKMQKELQLIVSPQPNTSSKLRFYNLMGGDDAKGFWKKMRNRFGEQPRLYLEKDTIRNKKAIKSYLYDNGYFKSIIISKIESAAKKAKSIYHVTAGSRATIVDYSIADDSTSIGLAMATYQDQSLIKSGMPYSAEILDMERSRLARSANNDGFINFKESDLFYLADTTESDYTQVSLYLMLSQDTDKNSYQRYRIGSTTIVADYNLKKKNNKQLSQTYDTTETGILILQDKMVIKPSLIERLLPRPVSSFYSKSEQVIVQKRLQSLGVFKYINIQYRPNPDTTSNLINRTFLLTPSTQQEVNGSIELNNQTGNFFGTSATASYLHKNLFGGAQRFNFDINSGIATQLNNGASFLNTSSLDLKGTYSLPYTLGFKRAFRNSVSTLPRTIISASVGWQNRVNFYRLNTIEINAGYRWTTTARSQHELYPVQFSVFKLNSSTLEFQEARKRNTRLDRSFEDVVIAGLKYVYTSHHSKPDKARTTSYFTGEVETSGNLMWAFANIFQNTAQPSILKLPVAQYIRFNIERRSYTKFNKGTIATRVAGGIGIAYGQSEELPYSRQFSIGGANSLRAYPLRGLGPGLRLGTDALNPIESNQFFDQTGGMRIEMNAEYRFPIFAYLKGAFFIDAGNIWLLTSEAEPESVFSTDALWNQMALGSGIGFRLDFDYFVVRLDTAFALRGPDEAQQGFSWFVSDVSPFSGKWRRDNLQWHLSFGYPF